MSKERIDQRKDVRRSLTRRGGLHVPEHMKDANFVYRWVNLDKEQPFKMDEKLDIGYEPVPVSDFPELKSRLSMFAEGDNMISNGTYICRAVSDKVTAFLMRIPKAQHEEISVEKARIVDETESRMKNDARKKEGFYGSIDTGTDV